MPKYSRGLDQLLAAALKLRARDFEGASELMVAFANAEDFDEQVDQLLDMNDEAFDSDEPIVDDGVEGDVEYSEDEDTDTEIDEADEDDEAAEDVGGDDADLMDDGDETEDDDSDEDDYEFEEDTEEEETTEDDGDEVAQFAATLERATIRRSRSLNRQVASKTAETETASTETIDVEVRRQLRAQANLRALRK